MVLYMQLQKAALHARRVTLLLSLWVTHMVPKAPEPVLLPHMHRSRLAPTHNQVLTPSTGCYKTFYGLPPHPDVAAWDPDAGLPPGSRAPGLYFFALVGDMQKVKACLCTRFALVSAFFGI